ncbi:putative NADH-flavin reductase [Acinetobacter baylyi]|uniref:NADH-flavin reductase n=1 Tax=Acinetobacter baylyi TaxID=202950 RepID=A0ABU0UWA7_ACIBI|nr:NAD(P)-dependent oxidoreductase [Acinetobacter baylyi]MDQ1208845.1 putative NADH-flavin reductase [Acinetobacter baylyi]MDR6107562.1 putative NADH-flavin reductase [Acinetobacter baylyi]MDR6185716.1 putative NADH-flavin reductase [Acinetobacter baylyi]
MKIALIGATGMAGSRILEELVSRGHYVKALARDTHKVADTERVMAVDIDLNDHDALVEALRGQDAVISAVRFHGLDANALFNAIHDSKVRRYLVVGGAGSLHVPHQNTRVLDSEDFPEAYKPEAEAAAHFLDKLKEKDDLDWTFISPSAEFGPGKRTGEFRLGKDELLVGEEGSKISAEDFAVALADELEHNNHIQQRFTVGY